jgi:hypothetical protein
MLRDCRGHGRTLLVSYLGKIEPSALSALLRRGGARQLGVCTRAVAARLSVNSLSAANTLATAAA